MILMRAQAPFHWPIVLALLLPLVGSPALSAAVYVPPGCLLAPPALGTGPDDCPGSVAGDPMHDAVHGAPRGEYIDLATGIVYQWSGSGLTPIGASAASLGYMQLTTCGNRNAGDQFKAEQCQSTSPTAQALLDVDRALRPDCDRPGIHSWRLCHQLHVAMVDCVEVKIEYVSSARSSDRDGNLASRVYAAPECTRAPLLAAAPERDNARFTTSCNMDAACVATEAFRYLVVPCAYGPADCVNGVTQEFAIGPSEAIESYDQFGQCWFEHIYPHWPYYRIDHDPAGGIRMPEDITAILIVGGVRVGTTTFQVC